jgi:outer membrane immunogenic protein
MKKILLSSVALMGLTVGATAADLPRRVAPVPYVPVPVFTWTGFYLGVNAGAGFNNDNNDPCFGSFGFGSCGTGLGTLVVPSVPGGVLAPVVGGAGFPTGLLNNNNAFFGDNHRNRTGFVGGGQIGYNYQFTPGSGLVIGIEADAQYAGFGRRRNNDGFFGFNNFGAPVGNGIFTAVPAGDGIANPGLGIGAPTGLGLGATGNVALFNNAFNNGFNGFNGFGNDRNRSDFLGTVRGRLGWAFDRLLVYATGGVAFTGNDRNNNNVCFGGFAFAGCGFGNTGGVVSGAALVGTGFYQSAAAQALGAAVVPTNTTATPFFTDRRNNNDVRAVVGGGLEYAFTNNLTVKIEGLYIFDDNHHNDNNFLGFGTGGVVGVTNNGAPVIATGNGNGFLFDNHRRDDITVVRAGLNYKFNWW